ncbi:DUF6875 domain-containing protein [Nocardia sp. NPDC050630]|uniref:DUF6875 domain-containing protein n=1 Tax=Nocardia sp. NPDC050630 TaxID=3364321 RepID=UPI0037A11FBA
MGVVRTWAEEHLSAQDPDMSRDGPVCPYVAPSMSRDLMWVARTNGKPVSVGRHRGN